MRGGWPGKAWMLINLAVTAGISKEADDTLHLIIEAIVSTATDASTAGIGRIGCLRLRNFHDHAAWTRRRAAAIHRTSHHSESTSYHACCASLGGARSLSTTDRHISKANHAAKALLTADHERVIDAMLIHRSKRIFNGPLGCDRLQDGSHNFRNASAGIYFQRDFSDIPLGDDTQKHLGGRRRQQRTGGRANISVVYSASPVTKNTLGGKR